MKAEEMVKPAQRAVSVLHALVKHIFTEQTRLFRNPAPAVKEKCHSLTHVNMLSETSRD